MFERKALATSDHPVYLVPNEELTRMGMGTGIENATAIHVPLTRRHSLAMYLPSAVPPQLAALGRPSLVGIDLATLLEHVAAEHMPFLRTDR